MKNQRKILIAGLLIIVLTNFVALAGVAYNRSGDPESVIELTERELSFPFYYQFNHENTGLSLNINCRLEVDSAYYSYMSRCVGRPSWFNDEKLRTLGFDISELQDKSNSYSLSEKYLSRQAYIVLEYDGDTYQRVLAKAEQALNDERQLQASNTGNAEFQRRVEEAEKRFRREQQANSRLFAIDVGMDESALRSQYPDTSRYIILAALVKPVWGSRDKKYQLNGMISDMLIDSVHIPLQHRSLFETFQDQSTRRSREGVDPRYKIKLAFGKRAEPWVMAVSPLGE